MGKKNNITPQQHYTDITKKGYQTFRELQAQNKLTEQDLKDWQELVDFDSRETKLSDYQANPELDRPGKIESNLARTNTAFGESFFDKDVVNPYEFEHLGDLRAENQWGISKLANGLGKMGINAATTFADGTIGLLYGIGDAVANIGNENETGWQTFSRIWDNEVSNGLQQINQAAEDILPNYKTELAQEGPWYNNIFTMDFLADDILKNMGFMIGSFYGGNLVKAGFNTVIRGGKALKAMNATRTFAEAYKKVEGMGTMGARWMGSLVSAVNEARIEANQVTNPFRELEYGKLKEALNKEQEGLFNSYQQEYNAIMNSNLSVAPSSESGISPKQQALKNLEAKYDKLKSNLSNRYQDLAKDIDNRAAKAGTIDLLQNIPLLMIDDFLLFGKLYSRGYSNSRDMAKRTIDTEAKNATKKGIFSRLHEAGERGLQEEAKEAGRIVREGNKYAVNKITSKESWKNVIKTGLREGNEEMAQQMASNLGGDLYEADGPDAYYKALTNSNYKIETKDFIDATIKAFNDSYGDKSQWEQFAVGAISALIGIPTFGRANNSDANTYLGRGKMIGLSGGLFGEFSNARKINKEAAANVEVMNKTMEKLNNHIDTFTMSKAFHNAMDGYSGEQDKFEFKNASDNEDFAIIQAFTNSGRLNDLLDKLNIDYGSLSDEEIGKIAFFNSQKDKEGNIIGGFVDKTGRPLVSIDPDTNTVNITSLDAAEAREILNKHKEDMSNKVQKYSDAINKVRGIGNNSLDRSQEQELAWLLWKYDVNKDRLRSIINNDKNLEGIYIIREALKDMLHSYEAERKQLDEDKDKEIIQQNDSQTKGLFTLVDFINLLDKYSKDTEEGDKFLASLFNNNKQIAKLLTSEDFFNSIWGHLEKQIDYSSLVSTMQNIVDSSRLLNSMVDFNERYKEFITDPAKIIRNRNKIDSKNKKKENIINNANTARDIKNSKVSDLSNLDEDDFSNLDNIEDLDAGDREKLDKVKEIRDKDAKIRAKLLSDLNSGKITREQYNAALNRLNNMKSKAENVDDLTDLASFAANEDILNGDVDPEDLAAFQKEQDDARSELEDIFNRIKEEEKEGSSMPKDDIGDINPEDLAEFNPSTEQKDNKEKNKEKKENPVTRDPTPHIESESERQKKEAEKKKKEEEKESVKADKANLEERIKLVIDKFTEFLYTQLDSTAVDSLSKSLYHSAENIAKVTTECKKEGFTITETLDTLKHTDDYVNMNTVLQIAMSEVNNEIIDWFNTIKTEVEEKFIESEEEPTFSPSNIKEAIESTQKAVDNNNTANSSIYNFWKPTTPEVEFGYIRGKRKPFWQTAEEKGYPKEKVQRYKAIYEYLKEHNAWENAFNTKEGDTVEFIIDPELNEKAGEVVILMSVNGKIVGDVMSPNDASFNKQVALAAFVKSVLEEYKNYTDTGNTGLFKASKTTTIADKMVGKVPFSEIINTLNEVHTDVSGKRQPFKLGIVLSDDVGKSHITMTPKSKSRTTEDRSIIPPLKFKSGQPFLLIPTGSNKRAYIPVPILMDIYTPNSNTTIGKLVDTHIAKLATLKNDTKEIVSWIREMQDLLSIPALNININKGIIKVSVRNKNDNTAIVIYKGPQNVPTLISSLQEAFTNNSFQISRKYINSTFQGMDYNSIIGEVAYVNLDQGSTHPISSWFTIKPISSSDIKPVRPKSTKTNPMSINSQFSYFTYTSKSQGVINVRVDNNTYDLYFQEKSGNWKKNNKESGRTKVFKALAYINNNGIVYEKDIASTPFGYYNRITNTITTEMPKPIQNEINSELEGLADFITNRPTEDDEKESGKTSDDENSTSSSTKNSNDTEFTPSSTDNSKVAKIVNRVCSQNPLFSTIYNELLTHQQRILIARLGVKKAEGILNLLFLKYDKRNKSFKQGTNIDEIISGTKNRLVTKETTKRMRRRELAFVHKLLPQMSSTDRIRIVDGLIKIGNNEKAWGQFRDGIIYLSNEAAPGTGYHEAFHAVVDTLLSEGEVETMFKEAANKYGGLDRVALEEKLAEDFRKYMQLEEIPVVGSIVKLFRSLKHILQNLFGKEPYLNNLYYRISRNKLESKLNDNIYYENMDNSNPNIYQERENDIFNTLNKALRQDKRLLDLANKENATITDLYNILKVSEYDDAIEVLDYLFKGSDNYLKDIRFKVINVDNYFGYSDRVNTLRSKFNGRRAYYDASNNTIYINAKASFKNGNCASVLMHELMHAVTLSRLNSNPKIKNKFREIFEEYYKHYAGDYRKIDSHHLEEFIADIWSNKVTIEKLKRIPCKENKFISLFKKVMNFLKNELFGYAPENSMFIQASNIMVQLLQEDAGIRPKEKFYENELNTPTPIKNEFKGKLIFAQSGSGKSSIADNKTVIDGDYIMAKNLGTSTEFINIIYAQLSNVDKAYFTELYHKEVNKLLSEGKTVITASLALLKQADYIVYNSSIENTNTRTSDVNRKGANNFIDTEYQSRVFDAIQEQISLTNTPSIQLKDSQYLADVLLTDPLYKAYQKENMASDVTEACTKFLANFGITTKSLEDYNGNIPLFDALNRVVNYNSKEQLTEATGYAIAFMMQHSPIIRELISAMRHEPKSIKRAFKKSKNLNFNISDWAYKLIDKDPYLHEIGKDIANELIKFYNNEDIKPNNNWIRKVWSAIREFFNIMSPKNREYFYKVSSYTKTIAEAIVKNQPNVVTPISSKPGTTDKVTDMPHKVDVIQALKENPYEKGIVIKLSNYNMALGGSASLALAGTVYRPSENPLHDLDFMAIGYTKETLIPILNKEFKNVEHIRTIAQESSKTETFLTIDRPFEIRRDTEHMSIYSIYDKNTGEKIGQFIKSNLVLKEGIDGKFLDFFCLDKDKFGISTINFEGHDIVYANPEWAMEAKIDWKREKDIWDYRQFKPLNKEELYQRQFEQHYRDKYMYSNLSNNDKQFLDAKHISIEDYNQMSNKEKEVLFRCKL